MAFNTGLGNITVSELLVTQLELADTMEKLAITTANLTLTEHDLANTKDRVSVLERLSTL